MLDFKKFKFLIGLAVVHTTAFFLYGSQNLEIDFVEGTVEVLNVDDTKRSSILRLNKGDSITLEHWICTGPSSRAQFSNDKITYRLGSMSVVSFNDENNFKLHSGSFLFVPKKKVQSLSFLRLTLLLNLLVQVQ